MSQEITKTFVEILYPGVIFSETETKEIPARDLPKVVGWLPKGAYAFRFFDQVVGTVQIDGDTQEIRGKRKNISGSYYPGLTRVLNAEQVAALGGNHSILLSNMHSNHYEKVIQTRCGNFVPFNENDEVIP